MMKPNVLATKDLADRQKTVKSWTLKEDSLLVEAVNQFGKNNWRSVEEVVMTRTRKQCRERYLNHLDDSVEKRAWTQEEDDIIMKRRTAIGNKWTRIAQELKGRSPNAVKNRFFGHLNKLHKNEKTVFTKNIEDRNSIKDEVENKRCLSSPRITSAFSVVDMDKYFIIK
ncbi:transcription factor MYB90, putative [Entamoeba invadens IP1]|uniref:Transcription factor MYB90, putative n=1 Tax=Entamoeba invadens IP1 TaxID=370355 RepID=A0A0A1TYY1_ENTIV|nr:transcription factor MYB90, putative [Entamoeba invadens IP1]ELP86735.1 transcription factor MYB90, putative [Entamoeba invadens IP1]|eukprot:XP_004186081.1 transcription factor MYB90, putative [Entamoeba invadens IP1]